MSTLIPDMHWMVDARGQGTSQSVLWTDPHKGFATRRTRDNASSRWYETTWLPEHESLEKQIATLALLGYVPDTRIRPQLVLRANCPTDREQAVAFDIRTAFKAHAPEARCLVRRQPMTTLFYLNDQGAQEELLRIAACMLMRHSIAFELRVEGFEITPRRGFSLKPIDERLRPLATQLGLLHGPQHQPTPAFAYADVLF